MVTEQATRLSFPAARAVHIVMPPHAPDGYTAVSDAFAIGVSFTGHERAVYADANGRSAEVSFPAGMCGINGCQPITWLEVTEQSEALEIYPSAAALDAVAAEVGIDWLAHAEYRPGPHDPVIWGICARFRMAAMGSAPLNDLEAEGLIHRLLVHVAVRRYGAPAPRREPGRLDQRRLGRVTAFLDSALAAPPSLHRAAEVAAMSPFHFQRAFRNATGLSPHDYVMARRLERARRLLAESGATVAAVAAELGFADLRHFRRAFRRQFNRPPRYSSSTIGLRAADPSRLPPG